VDEGLLQQIQVTDREPDPFREGLGGSHDPVVGRCPSGA
jgi:hypothetical protein